MQKLYALLSMIALFATAATSANAARAFLSDPEDPLWLGAQNNIYLSAAAQFKRSTANVPLYGQWAVNDNLALGVGMTIQEDLNSREDGASNVGVNGIYRVAEGRGVMDVIGGIRLGYSDSKVPEFHSDIYSLGVRFGTIRNKITLGAEIKTSWIFNRFNGHAFIDLTPFAYLRLNGGWNIGAELEMKKDTNYDFGQDDMAAFARLVKNMGSTSYTFGAGYRISDHSVLLSGKLSLLF